MFPWEVAWMTFWKKSESTGRETLKRIVLRLVPCSVPRSALCNPLQHHKISSKHKIFLIFCNIFEGWVFFVLFCFVFKQKMLKDTKVFWSKSKGECTYKGFLGMHRIKHWWKWPCSYCWYQWEPFRGSEMLAKENKINQLIPSV